MEGWMKNKFSRRALLKSGMASAALVTVTSANSQATERGLRGTGDLGLIIERADGAVLIIDTSDQTILSRITGLGDLSHASVVFSRDGRYGFVFGRDGGLTKVDLLEQKITARVVQSGNSIGGAISQDGRFVAVSNYTPGGVKIFDTETLELVHDIPSGDEGARSKVVGLTDAPGSKFIFTLYDTGEIWVLDLKNPVKPAVRKFKDVGALPYDALITPDGRYYMAGLFGEDGMAQLDLWDLGRGTKRILDGYGRGEEPLPVYKMPHLEGWAATDGHLFVPAVGRHEVLIIDKATWTESGRIAVHGQPIFVMARPDGRHVWVNFALPNNDTVEIIDVKSSEVIRQLKPGKAILHMEFTPRGEQVWLSARDEGYVAIYDTESFEELKRLPARSPSGIFFTSRAHQIGL
jgi:protein NirF